MKSLLRFVHNVWWFRKELWAWWNWDQEPTLRLLKRALEGMYEAHRDDPYHEDHGRIAKDIKICIHLLNRIIEDYYFLDKFEYKRVESTIPVNTGQAFKSVKIHKIKRYDLPSTNMVSKLDLKKQDTELLFKIMKKINGWWC